MLTPPRSLVSSLALLMLFIGLNVHAKPSIDLDSPDSIKAAAHAALTRLNEQNHYGIDGGFYGSVNDDSVPMWWWMSAPVYDSLLEYSKWTGDTDSFNIDAATRLAHMSNGPAQNTLFGHIPGISDRENDDIAWVAIAIQSGADVYGGDTSMPGTVWGKWNVVGKRTIEQMWESRTDACGGGLRWKRGDESATYKSSITNLDFIVLAAKIYLMDEDEDVLNKAKEIWDWMTDTSDETHKPLITEDGAVHDGFSEDDCTESASSPQWSYNMGMAIQGSALLYKATNDEKYLKKASALLAHAREYYGTVVKEPECGGVCDRSSGSDRNHRMFKGIYVRALVALYRLTTKDSDKEAIRAIIKDSVNAMVRNACDKEWHCNGDWDRGGTMQDALDQSVSSSLLVAASGIFGSNTDDGFRPKVLRKRSRRAQRIDKAT